jgi:transglutaminase-like putative cysteine protease
MLNKNIRAAVFMVVAVLAANVGVLSFGESTTDNQHVTIDQIAEGIESYITEKTEADGGYFKLKYDGKELSMKLVRIHMEYLSDLGGGVHFACVDLVSTDGPVYDVDFFLKGKPGAMTVTDTTAHKINGQPLYTWEQRDDDTWFKVPVTNASDRLLGLIEGKDTFDFLYRVRLPDITGSAQIWLPLAKSDAFQTVDIESIDAPEKYRELRDSKYGNNIFYMTADSNDSGKTIEVKYTVTRSEKNRYEDDKDHSQYLEPDKLVPNDKRFHKIAEKVVAGKKNDLMRARALYDHVIEKVRYAKYGSGWGRGDAIYACDVASGNCTDFHSYFIALARSINIPARFAIGAAIPSERNEGGIDGYHCWAEFYADNEWWPVDISEGDKYSRLAGYFFGHHPANRIEFSQGRDLIVEPGPHSGPINFLAYPVLEIDGKQVKAPTEFIFERADSNKNSSVDVYNTHTEAE